MDFEDNIKKYKLVIHCGALNPTTKKLQNRFAFCEKHKVPITNYGVLIAYLYLNSLLEKPCNIFVNVSSKQ